MPTSYLFTGGLFPRSLAFYVVYASTDGQRHHFEPSVGVQSKAALTATRLKKGHDGPLNGRPEPLDLPSPGTLRSSPEGSECYTPADHESARGEFSQVEEADSLDVPTTIVMQPVVLQWTQQDPTVRPGFSDRLRKKQETLDELSVPFHRPESSTTTRVEEEDKTSKETKEVLLEDVCSTALPKTSSSRVSTGQPREEGLPFSDLEELAEFFSR